MAEVTSQLPVDSLKRTREAWSESCQLQAPSKRTKVCDLAQYVRVSGASTKELNGLYELLERSPCFRRPSYWNDLIVFVDPDDATQRNSAQDEPGLELYSEAAYAHTDRPYRILRTAAGKWWMGRLHCSTTEFKVAALAHSALDPAANDPVQARLWKERCQDQWQPVPLAVRAVTEEEDVINITVVSVAGVELLRDRFSLLESTLDIVDALVDNGAVNLVSVKVQLCFDGEVLQKYALLGGLPGDNVILHAVVKERRKLRRRRICDNCCIRFHPLRLRRCQFCNEAVCPQCCTPEPNRPFTVVCESCEMYVVM
eukprot:TRINITY_DN113751_c0_g1_i1.p1 TRINITY_DN113751_c0_g1~~TRINITY_DN113751_c0_g1_i1.p1  ORF type:complete len:313 (+),score=25.81 TRINITY_DN113751_c0_g1_i1:89-1027(+)